MNLTTRSLLFSFGLALLFASPLPAADDPGARLDALVDKIQKQPGATSSEEMLEALRLGKELGRPYPASLAAKAYLSQNLAAQPAVLLAAAENARLAGDLRTAASRYKQYLRAAPASPQNSDIAADLYQLLLEHLNTPDDAYVFMEEQGEKFRQSVNARKYDGWFLQVAQSRNALKAASRRLAAVFADGLPLEQERLLFWGYLDWATYHTTRALPEHYGALEDLRQLAGRIRESQPRSLSLAFYVANLGFKAAAAGKDAATLETDVAPVIAAGKAYFDAFPTAATLGDLFGVFGGGRDRWDENEWLRGVKAKQALLLDCFRRLPDPEKEKALGIWLGHFHNHLATAEQWNELALQSPEVFKRAYGVAWAQFAVTSKDPEYYKKLAPILENVGSQPAIAIATLGAGDDLRATMKYCYEKQAWAMQPPDFWGIFFGQVWGPYSQFPRDEAHRLPGDYGDKLILQFGAEYITRTPIALWHPDAAREYVNRVWTSTATDANDKSKVADLLHGFDWVPYTAEQRQAVFGPAFQAYRQWAEAVRKGVDDARRAAEGAGKGAADNKTARDATVKSRDDTTKARDDAKQALAQATTQLEQAKAAVAEKTKQQTEAQAALKAAQDAKDDAKVNTVNGQLAELAKGLGDANQLVAQQTQQVQELTTKIQQAEQSLQQLTTQLQAQETQLQAAIKGADDNAANLKKAEAVAAQLAPLEQHFQQVLNPAVADPNKAPNPLCQNLAKAAQALQAKNRDAYLAAARAMYPLVREYDTQKLPFGGFLLRWLVENRLGQFDTFDFQCEVLADQLGRWRKDKTDAPIREAIGGLINGRPNWGWDNWPAADKERILKINDIFAKALRDQLNAGQFWAELFGWFRSTRRGNGWTAFERNTDVLALMIEKRVLEQNPTVRYAHNTATTSYQWLIRSEFPSLNDKYPVERYFDARFIEEFRQTKLIDYNFWAYSRDEKKQVFNAAAAVLEEFEKAPFGWDGQPALYSPGSFWELHQRVLWEAEDGPRQSLLAKLESYYGKTRFDGFAMGRGLLNPVHPNTPEGRKEWFARLNRYVDRVAAAPQFELPPWMNTGGELGPASNLTSDELGVLLKLFRLRGLIQWVAGQNQEGMGQLTFDALMLQKRQRELFECGPSLWRMTRDCNWQDGMRNFARNTAALMAPGAFDLAGAMANNGIEIVGRNLVDDARNTLLAVRSKSLSSVAAIPVERGDPRFPLFAAQAAFGDGKFENAWELYLSGRGQFGAVFKDLDPAFMVWLVDHHADAGDFAEAERIAKELIQWMDAAPAGFDPEVRGRLLVAFANIPFLRQEFPRARALYERVAAAKEFEGTRAAREAALKVAEVDRLTKHYDKAIEQLEKLARSKDTPTQAEANYQLALVKFDQEEYPEARSFLDQVFAADPSHANARILEGRLYLQLKKLVEATEVKVGLASNQKTIVPGRPLKVQLEDKNLAVVGKSVDIEIRVWTDSGDEEFFNLLPFGDSKTKFEGQVPTALGATQKGDHVLQVLGNDVVHYDFSDRFKQLNKIAAAAPLSATVAADAELAASSGELLTREEVERRELARQIQRRSRLDEAATAGVALSSVRAENEIKPGNKINVRVTDFDRDATNDPDTLNIRVATSSGDRLDVFTLRETGPHTGIFEGQVPTATAPATAFASDSEEGREPNFVITSGDYPAWVALANNQRPKAFSIDLNNNIPIGRLRLTADVPGRRLKRFILQSSLNGKTFQDVAVWPEGLPAWNGAPQFEFVRYAGVNRLPQSFAEAHDYCDVGFAAAGAEKIIVTNAAPTARWDGNVAGLADKLKLTNEGGDSWYIARYRAAFYVPQRQMKTFRIDPQGRLGNIRYFLAVDDVPGPEAGEVRRALDKGVHLLDIYVCAHRHAGPAFVLLGDIPNPPYLAPCTLAQFDPAQHPELARAAFVPATVQSDVSLRQLVADTTAALEKGKADRATIPADQADKLKAQDQLLAGLTATLENANRQLTGAGNPAPDGAASLFDITFATNTSARVLRFWLVDFETDAPALRKLRLESPDGQVVLPPAEDLVQLKKNDKLEIVPGDRVSVTYEDPKFLTKERQVQESFLTATYHNATVSACLLDSVLDANGNRRPLYILMQRFTLGDPVNVFISDPDLDVTEGQDKLPFTVRTPGGQSIKLEALESEPHSGVFLGRVFPVLGEPQRPSEIKVAKGEEIVVSYLDRENTDPGIPWERTGLVEQSGEGAPDVRVYEVTSRELTPEELRGVASTVGTRQVEEVVPVTRTIIASRPAEDAGDKPVSALLGCPLIVELSCPALVQSPRSEATIYLQTAAGRQAYGKPVDGAFDLNVPGTIKLTRYPGDVERVPAPPGYREVSVQGNPYRGSPLEDGRFMFPVPMRLAPVPAKSLANEETKDITSETLAADPNRTETIIRAPYVDNRGQIQWAEYRAYLPTLAVRGGDEVFVGMRYKDAAGAEQWVVRKAALRSDAFFDVMDRRYQESLKAVHVGETISVRLIDPSRDRTDAQDEVAISVAAASGTNRTAKLSETFPHSGIFKGTIPLVFAGDVGKLGGEGAVGVQYGDKVTVKLDEPALERVIEVHKGADGDALPFTKRFREPEIAVQTQFTVAEAYFEMAKKHRELKQEELARREIAQGKKLLEEAIRDYPTTEFRAQADYLLANLSLEYADEAKDEETKRKHYLEAVARFTDIVASYSDSAYAPKAQYKKALVFEKMGKIDQACEEYVKLSYRYPENELVAETIARLGQYFLTKGKDFTTRAGAETNLVERERITLQAKEMYKTAAQVFGRLAERFPDHQLAGKTTVLSAQCYIRAEDLAKAIAVFRAVIDAKKAEPDLIAQAMYWGADCYMKRNDPVNAYRLFKRVTWDYPESTWAKYARGRLTEEAMARVEATESSDTGH